MASTAVIIKDYRAQIPGKIVGNAWEFPQVNSMNVHGRQSEWKIVVRLFDSTKPLDNIELLDDSTSMQILDMYFAGQLPANIYAWTKVYSRLFDGKIRDTIATITTKGKNPGRVNATNVFTQALRDALGIHNKQVKKAVNEAKQLTGVKRYPPMLASLLRDRKEPLDFTRPVFAQRKYDGVRAMAVLDVVNNAMGEPTNVVTLYSRTKLPYPGFEYIKTELLPMLQTEVVIGEATVGAANRVYLDGEIYKHGVPLQDISGYARRESKPADVLIDYMIYDVFVPGIVGMQYPERKLLLEQLFAANPNLNHVKPVETFAVANMDEINKLYEGFIAEEYEGAMIRLPEQYVPSNGGYHSSVLLKMKPVMDSEYEIIGHTTGKKGKAASALMFICKTDAGREFSVTPAMELPERNALAARMDTIENNGQTYFTNNYFGKKLIVIYDDLSRDGVPQRARTKGVIRTWD